ncbi:hypothetical protein SAMN05192544_101858 [Paraburkholderia hospita]|nr:hypothetical protein SAMN05192544_101858 [Paraburkholderia hospita]
MAVPDGQPSVRANDVKDASSMRLLIEESLLDRSESRRRGTGGGIFLFLSGRWGGSLSRLLASARRGALRWHPGFAFVLASALCLRASCVAPVRLPLRWHPRFALVLHALPLCVCLCAGIRVFPPCFKRRPCAGRHLLFFAAAKKSRQKKAAHTVSSCSCLRAPRRSHASHGNAPVRVRCQRLQQMPHPLQTPA